MLLRKINSEKIKKKKLSFLKNVWHHVQAISLLDEILGARLQCIKLKKN